MPTLIEEADVSLMSLDRNFVTLWLETDEGHVGMGDATAPMAAAPVSCKNLRRLKVSITSPKRSLGTRD